MPCYFVKIYMTANARIVSVSPDVSGSMAAIRTVEDNDADGVAEAREFLAVQDYSVVQVCNATELICLGTLTLLYGQYTLFEVKR